MTADSAHLIESFHPGALSAILDDENVNYRLEEHNSIPVVRTGFLNAAISFIEADGMLNVEAMWRGAPSTNQAAEVLAATNEWNLTQISPTIRFFELNQGSLAINGVRSIVVSAGLSHNQIGAFVMGSLEAINTCFGWLDQQFPALVTWKDDEHEH